MDRTQSVQTVGGDNKTIRTGGRIALFASVIGLLAVATTIWAEHVMSDWGGGNFPPLIGHLFVIVVGAVALFGMLFTALVALVSATLLVVAAKKKALRTSWRLAAALALSGFSTIYLWCFFH